MENTFTESIVRLILDSKYEQLPPIAIDSSKRAILDCLGVAVAGCGEASSKIVSGCVKDGGKPEAGVIGAGIKTAIDQAAWANGTAAHALDYDDYFVPDHLTPYHPTVTLLPAILAVAQRYRLTGKDILLAYITGFEVEAEIAMVCVKQQYDLGWHTTSTLGSIGVTAAVAKALKLDKDQIRMALGISASFASGLRKSFGTMTKPLHAGNSARNGVIAATLAQRGFTADGNILDAPLGFFEVLGGGEANKMKAHRPSRGSELHIVSPGIGFKPYPSCAYTHWAIDAALKLKREVRINPADVSKIECYTSSGLPRVLIHSHPRTSLEAKFSLQYCVAIALIDGEVLLKQFSEQKVNSSEAQELTGKIDYVHPVELGSGLHDLGGKLVIRLQGGELYSQEVNIARGDPRNPLTQAEVERKYADCVFPYLSPEDRDRSLELITHLDSTTDISELMDILTFGRRS